MMNGKGHFAPLLCALCIGCGSDPASLTLDDREYTDRLDERERRMALSVIDENGVEQLMTADAFEDALALSDCGTPDAMPDVWSQLAGSSDPCMTDMVEQVFRRDCIAQQLLETAEAETPTTLDFSFTFEVNGEEVTQEWSWTVPPQLPEARIAVARKAASEAQRAVVIAGDTLRYHAGQDPSTDPASDTVAQRLTACDVGSPGSPPTDTQLDASSMRDPIAPTSGASFTPVTPLALLAEVLVGSTATVERAARIEFRNQTAVAEAEFARSRSNTIASRLSWTDKSMSRIALAKHLFGSTGDGLYGYEEDEGLCPCEAPTGSVEGAIELLRTTGIDPRVLLDLDIPLADLALGGGSVPADQSLLARIEALSGDTLDSPTLASVLASVNLSAEDVESARFYMRHEARAFSLQHVQAAEGIPLTPLVTFDAMGNRIDTQQSLAAWASVLREPVPPPAIYNVGAAMFHGVSENYPDDPYSFMVPISAEYGLRSVTHTIDYAYSVATDFGVMNSGDEPHSSFLALPDDALKKLNPLVLTAAQRVPARVMFCEGSPGAMDIVAWHRDDDFFEVGNDFLVVRGVSGLRCATEGLVHGERCDLDEYRQLDGAYRSEWDTNRINGIRNFAHGSDYSFPAVATLPPNALPQEAADAEFLYALHRVRGKGNADLGGPGDFEAIAAYRISESGTPRCVTIPYVPEYVEMGDRLLQPSTEYCAMTATTCAGPSFAARIPLENELSGDDGGRGLENSWQYWLNLAEQSAELADRLGEDMLTSGATLDESLESLEESLTEYCGAPVNISDAFFDMLDDAPGGTCTTAMDCDSGFGCTDNYCVRDIDAMLMEPQFAVLAGCIGDSEVAPFVAAGDTPLCAWRLTGTTAICTQPDMGDPILAGCPWRAIETGVTSPDGTPTYTCANPSFPSGAPVAEVIQIDETLDIFPTPPEPETQETLFDCNVIREMRTSSGAERARLAELVAAQPMFSRDSMRTYANRIGYIAEPDDYGMITLDSKRWRGFGGATDPATIGLGEVTEWPCAEEAAAECSGGGVFSQKFFCAHTTGCGQDAENDRINRAFMNQRVARAVLALHLVTGADPTDVELPFRPEPLALTTEADVEDYDSDDPYNEIDRWKWVLQDSSDDITLRNAAVLVQSTGVEFRADEHDWVASDEGSIDIDGRVYCEAGLNAEGWIWTHFLNGNYATPQKIYVPCHHDDEWFGGGNTNVMPSEYFDEPATRTQAVVFRSMPGGIEGGFPGMLPLLWQGMGPTSRIPARVTPGHPVPIAFALRDGGDGYVGEIPGVAYATESRTQCFWSGLSGYVCRSISYTDYWNGGPNEANRYNDLHVMKGVSYDDLLDAFELTCEVAADDFADPPVFTPSSCGDWDSLVEGGVANLRQGQRMVMCLAQEVESRAATQVFQDLPYDAIASVRGTSSIPGGRGEAYDDITLALLDLGNYPNVLAGHLRRSAHLLQQARIAAARNETQQELNRVDRMSTQVGQAFSCVASVLRAAGQGVSSSPSDGFGAGGGLLLAAAAADCANSVAQIVFAQIREGLLNDLSGLDEASQLAQIAGQLGDIMEDMKTAASEAQKSAVLLRGMLSGLEARRVSALGELADALVTYGNESAVSTLQRRNFNTNVVRYREAHDRAINTAWLARRALEQRLGRSLSEMDADMALVDAPASWADELCTMGGMDYQAITRDYELPGGDEYSREFVGDYVRRLRDVYDSYSVDHPFTTGDDLAVVSMRDDIFHTRQTCSADVRNLLAFSGELSNQMDPRFIAPVATSGDDDSTRVPPPIWEHEGCVPYTNGDGDVRTGGCIAMTRLLAAGDEPIAPDPELGAPSGWRIQFGGSSTRDPGYSSYSADTRITQRVDLEPGTYRLSWRGRQAGMGTLDPADAVAVTDAAGTALAVVQMNDAYETAAWDLHYLFFAIDEAQTVQIRIHPNDPGVTATTTPIVVDLGAFMLENVTRELGFDTGDVDPATHSFLPYPYIDTRYPAEAVLPVCPDVDGEVFRTLWERDCVDVCPTGGEGCAFGRRACFWEASFSISQEDLEAGTQLAQSGFANGNYNYRWNTFAANVVGTNVRDCEGLGATCYSAGYVPVSVYHEGDFEVRNHWGELYSAPLYDGRLEEARALAAERYLTNPVSGADSALMEPYTRHEMRGRPLDGQYRVRVWDDPGVRFDRIEDIQLVLGYRYWTSLD